MKSEIFNIVSNQQKKFLIGRYRKKNNKYKRDRPRENEAKQDRDKSWDVDVWEEVRESETFIKQ